MSVPVLRIDGVCERLRGLLEHGCFSLLSFLVGFELVSPGGLDRTDQIFERERVEYYDDNDHADTREREAVGEYLNYGDQGRKRDACHHRDGGPAVEAVTVSEYGRFLQDNDQQREDVCDHEARGPVVQVAFIDSVVNADELIDDDEERPSAEHHFCGLQQRRIVLKSGIFPEHHSHVLRDEMRDEQLKEEHQSVAQPDHEEAEFAGISSVDV